jgi:hypothetical protein
VVRTGEAASGPDPVGHDDGATVAALVDEGAHFATRPARDEHRHVHHGHRLVRRRTAQLPTERQHQRDALEQLDLACPAFGVEVVLGGHPHDLVGLRRRVPGEHVLEVVARHVDHLPSVRRRLHAGE